MGNSQENCTEEEREQFVSHKIEVNKTVASYGYNITIEEILRISPLLVGSVG